MTDLLLTSLGHWQLLAQASRLPPLIKVKVYLALLFLLIILLFLIVFNRLMARWARLSSRSSSADRKRSSSLDQDDWARRPLIDEVSDEEENSR
jgi:hypothetical protein